MSPPSPSFTELASDTPAALEEPGQPGQPPPNASRTRIRPILITSTASFTEINTFSLVVAPTSSSTPDAKSAAGSTSEATSAPSTSSFTNTAASSAPVASQPGEANASLGSQLFSPGNKLFVVGLVIIGFAALIAFIVLFILVRCVLRRRRARARPRTRSMSEKRNTSSNEVRPDRASDFWSADVNRSRGRSASFHSPDSITDSPKTPNEDAGLLKGRLGGLFDTRGADGRMETGASEIRDAYIRAEAGPHSNPMRVHFTPSVAMSDYTALSLDVQQPTSARMSDVPKGPPRPTTPTLVHRSLTNFPSPSQSSLRQASNPFLETTSDASAPHAPQVPPPVPPRSSARQASAILDSTSRPPPSPPRRSSTDIESTHSNSNPFQFDDLSRSLSVKQGSTSAPMVASPTDFRTPLAIQTDVSHVLAHLRHRLSDNSSALSDSPSEDKPPLNEGPGYFMHISPVSPGPHAPTRTSILSLSPSQISVYSNRSGPFAESSMLDRYEASGEREAKASMAGLRPEGSGDDLGSPALADSVRTSVLSYFDRPHMP